ncbi:MAG: hypothetical protein Q4F12_04385 [Erysipelotrichaceae bacterium]|nr:hypothetical protein [Erysipelotrichaceae bacterium]
MKKLVAGIDYQNKKNVLISEYVAYLRKISSSPVLKFAKDNNISPSLVKKYESGEYDYPSALIASNFCKNFSLTPKEFVDQFTISKDKNFNKDEYLETVNTYYHNLPIKEDNVELVKEFIDLKTFDKKPISNNTSAFKVPCDVLFTDGVNYIVGTYFKYEKVHKEQLTLDAYKDLTKAVANAMVQKNTVQANHKELAIRDYLFVVSSKNAFDALYKEKETFILNSLDLKHRCPVNIILFLLPKHNSTNYYYFNICGKDFIDKKDHYYNG